MYQELLGFHERPEPFSRYTTDVIWTDAHIAGQMLRNHLDPETDLASRRSQTIDQIVAWIERKIGLSGKSVCDLGCGPGLYATRMAERGAYVTGIDFSASSLDHARRDATARGLTIDYRQADYLAGGLPTDQDFVSLIYGDLCTFSAEQRRRLGGFKAGRGDLHKGLTATAAALNRNRAARNRHHAARARHDMRVWQVKRRKRTRHLIELGGLVVKAGIVDLTGDDRTTIYGALLWMAEKLKSEDGERARELWAGKGKKAFEAERPAGAHDRTQPQQDRA